MIGNKCLTLPPKVRKTLIIKKIVNMKTIVLWSSALLLATLTLTGCSSGDDGQDGQKVNPNEQQVNPNAQGDEQEKKGEDDPVVYMLPETHDLELTYDQMALVKKNNDFAFNLYRAINADASMQGKSNIVSPMSLNYVLGMLNDGAQGKTAEEITTLLGFAGCDKETTLHSGLEERQAFADCR